MKTETSKITIAQNTALNGQRVFEISPVVTLSNTKYNSCGNDLVVHLTDI